MNTIGQEQTSNWENINYHDFPEYEYPCSSHTKRYPNSYPVSPPLYNSLYY